MYCGLYAVVCAERFAWCVCERRVMSVVTNAMPMSPPMLRDRFMMPLTWLNFCGSTPAYETVWMGTKRNASPAIWIVRSRPPSGSPSAG